MHLLVDISAHGLGHLSQAAPVIAALRARFPKLQLTVRSAVPHTQLARRIAPGCVHVPEARDIGFVMHNAVDIDHAATIKAYCDLHRHWPERVAAEAQWLKAHRVDALLTNVAYLPLAAAARAGLPSASLCSLNWADLYIHYYAGQPWAAKIHDEILSAYHDAGCFLRVTTGLPMAGFARRRDIGPIARLGRRDRRAISRQLNISDSQRWILVAMGGLGFRLPIEDWPRTPGCTWLIPDEWQVGRADVRGCDHAGIDFADLLASADAVITKPGYGTFTEAACNGIPIVYLERDDWPETPWFSAWLAAHARSRVLPRARLMQGDFIDDLQQLWDAPAPAVPLVSGVDEAVAALQPVLGLG